MNGAKISKIWDCSCYGREAWPSTQVKSPGRDVSAGRRLGVSALCAVLVDASAKVSG